MPFLVAISLVLPLTLLSALIGIRIGRRIRGGLGDSERTQLFGVQASLLGLLALLLGFSFAMAETRYDLRKQLVIDESNAIGTARLRAGVIGDERGQKMQQLLDDYVVTRLAGYRAPDDAGLRAAIDRSLQLQRELWARVTELGRERPQSLPVSLLMQSLNEVIDLHTKRVAAGRNHVPAPVLVMLLFVAAVTMGWVGAGAGIGYRRAAPTTLLLSLLISLVIGVIVDLDQPRGGLIRISQAPLAELLPSPP
ncbi:MAG TPA: hypothetical protein VGL86_08825 [Polyangia bacterium]